MSQLGWIDFSPDERKKVRTVLAMLSEPGTLDELGVGQVRDAFSDLFGKTKIDEKYKSCTYKQAIEIWMEENRPAIKSNSESAYNRIVGILNPDKKGNKIDGSFFEE